MALESGIDASEAWRTIRGNAKSISINIPGMVSKLAAGNITVEYVINIYQLVRNSRNQLETLKATANLSAYVQDVKADQTYNVVAQIEAVTAAEQAVLDWIDANASGLSLTGDTAENAIANGSIVTNRFGAAATSALRTLLQSIADEIAG